MLRQNKLQISAQRQPINAKLQGTRFLAFFLPDLSESWSSSSILMRDAPKKPCFDETPKRFLTITGGSRYFEIGEVHAAVKQMRNQPQNIR
jgi:hypothetical protein